MNIFFHTWKHSCSTCFRDKNMAVGFVLFCCLYPSGSEKPLNFERSHVMGTFRVPSDSFWLWRQTVLGQFCHKKKKKNQQKQQTNKKTSISSQPLSTLFRALRDKTILTESFVYILDRSDWWTSVCYIPSEPTFRTSPFPGVKHTSDSLPSG